MTGVDVAAIRARAERMPAGPLTVKNADVIDTDGRAIAVAQDWGDWLAVRDVAEFIAHARTDVPALLDALAEAERQRDEALALCASFDPTSGPGRARAFVGDLRAALTDPRPPTATGV